MAARTGVSAALLYRYYPNKRAVVLSLYDQLSDARNTAFSRARVEAVFVNAVTGATDAPGPALGEAVGRILYLLHLGVILCWLLDRSLGQKATRSLLIVVGQVLPSAALALRLRAITGFVRSADALLTEALVGAMPPNGTRT